ncbi:hypothetical protein [Bordetella sp. 2513F-2]
MSDTPEALREAADRLARARREYERGETGLKLLRQSRTAFVHSLRNTGLSHAQACLKYDNCMEEQLRLHQQAAAALQYAERQYRALCAQAGTPAQPA